MKHYVNTFVYILAVVTAFVFIEDQSLRWITIAILSLVHLIVTGIGVTKIGVNYFIQSINNSRPNSIAFSFDDSPCPGDLEVLDLLKAEGIQAMFFVIGNNVEQNKEILARLHQDGHLIGNHSYSHQNNIGWSSTKKVQSEIQQCNNIIEDALGFKPTYYRPPFGILNPKIARAIKREGMVSVGWNLRTYDTTNRSKEHLTKRILGKMNHKGQIILFHSSGQHTLDLIKETIQHAKKNGIEIANFSDVLRAN